MTQSQLEIQRCRSVDSGKRAVDDFSSAKTQSPHWFAKVDFGQARLCDACSMTGRRNTASLYL